MSHPTAFYKYLTAHGTLAVLSGTRLRWSSPLCFDDPAEFRRMPKFEPSVAESYGLLTDTLFAAASGVTALDVSRLSSSAKRLFELIQTYQRGAKGSGELRRSCEGLVPDADAHVAQSLDHWVTGLGLDTARVLCVTTEPHSDLMWDGYAGAHHGAVLRFRHLPELSTPLLAARQVKYSHEPPVVGSGLDFLLYGDTKELRSRTLEAICFTKMASWSYQSEWRALTWRPEEMGCPFGDYPFYADELESVTLGSQATHDFRCSVADLVRTRFPKCRLITEAGEDAGA